MSVEVEAWLGTYDMNHDGWLGTLEIRSPGKGDCISSTNCYFIYYYNNQGEKFLGEVVSVDKELQYMEFNIQFPDNKQPFHAYIFSWDTSKIAGTTSWHERTFGFYAVKKTV